MSIFGGVNVRKTYYNGAEFECDHYYTSSGCVESSINKPNTPPRQEFQHTLVRKP